jgi:replicative DNA helicase
MLNYYSVTETEIEQAPMSIPHSREAEEAAVGAVLINPEIYYEVARVITTPEHFFIHRNKYIWESFGRLTASVTPVDLLTVCTDMEKAGTLEDVGGSAYITSLINQVPSSLNAVSYAHVIRDYWERRNGITTANRIAANAYNFAKPFSLSGEAGNILSQSRGIGNRVDAKDAASEMIDLMSQSVFCSTTLPDVDYRIGGLFPAEMSVLAGYSGTGKSALKQQIARHNAEHGKKVLLCDLEMTAAQTWFRMSCGDLGYDMNQVRSGRISPDARAEIMQYAAALGEKYQDKIIIYEAPMSPSDILSAVMSESPDLVFVDTLKNISGRDGRTNLRDWYDNVLNFIRMNIALSKEAGRPHVAVLHHLSREAKKINRKPTKEDLMFAGESDADGVHILWRQNSEGQEKDKTVVPVTWITEKSRFGWTGETDINFDLPKQSFYGMENRQ